MRTRLFLLPLLAILLCSGLVTAARDLSRCPKNLNQLYVYTFRDKCYQFCVYEERYWDSARDECKRLNGRMVVIPDQETQNFLVATLNAMQYDHNGIWIGLTDSEIEGHYQWDHGESPTYTHWMPGQPGVAAAFEDCVLMERKEGYMWADYHCHIWPQYYSFICQFDMVPQSTAPPPTTPPLPTSDYVSTQEVTGDPVSWPSDCTIASCSNDCGNQGHVVDVDGCPLPGCPCRGEQVFQTSTSS